VIDDLALLGILVDLLASLACCEREHVGEMYARRSVACATCSRPLKPSAWRVDCEPQQP